MTSTDGKRVAIVDDDPLFLDHLSSVFMHHGGIRAVTASNGDELFKKIADSPVSCIVLDYELGNETGLALGQAIKLKLADPPPIVMLTGAGSEKIATKAFRIGFSDYVTKRNLDSKELLSAVGGAISQRERERMLADEAAKLRENQRIDMITGLYTASYLRARMEELIVEPLNEGITLFGIEIEGFAPLRNHMGNAAAERAHRDFANKLAHTDVADGYCGHLGTRKLACMFERQLSKENAQEITQRILAEVRTTIEFNGSTIQIQAQVNKVCFPADASSLDAFVALAVGSKNQSFSDQQCTMQEVHGNDLNTGISDRRQNDIAIAHSHDRRKINQRKETRHRVLKRGKIIFAGLNTVVDCTVRNVSASGAHLRVDGYFAAPARFKLEIIGVGGPRTAIVRWQIGRDIGVEYQDDIS